jgi:predicted nuclease with TOPRIM domain
MLALLFAAGLCAAWWLIPIGLIFWAIMVVNIARQPGLILNYKMGKRAPLAPRFQSQFDQIQQVQINIYNTLAVADPSVRRAYKPVQSDVDALIEEAYLLCRRTSALENYRVVTERRDDLNASWVKINKKIEDANDDRIRGEYSETLKALEERMAERKRISNHLDRVDAQLASLINSLDSILAEMLRLKSLSTQRAIDNVPRLRQTLKEQSQALAKLAELEETIPHE